jgi:small subunit ribosomal protein S16
MKKIGRSHQAFFRICAIDKRAPRGGRPLEELGTYDPLVPDTDARALLKDLEAWQFELMDDETT